MSGISLDQTQQIHHIARLAVLALCARGVAAAEFESSPEVGEVVVRISRDSSSTELPVDVEFHDQRGQPLGGMSL